MNRLAHVPSRALVLWTVAFFSLVSGCASPTEVSPTDAGSPAADVSAGNSDVTAPSGDAGPEASVGRSGDADVDSGPGASDLGPTASDVRPSTPDVAPAGDGGGASKVKDLIGQLLGGIDQTEIQQAVMELYGMSLPNRASGTANYRKATDWAKATVEAKAPAVKVTFIEMNGLRNTEIVLPGTDPNAGMYIVGGHMDSVAAGPGADDDGSGSIGTMFIAMAFAKFKFKSEVRFMLFDAEERGFVGSTQYARALRMTCEPTTCLKLYINLDMISNDPRNRAAINVTTTDPQLRTLHTQINTDYMLGAMLVFGGNNCGTSDDCSFQRSGYKTIEIKEDDFSPNWHRPSDTMANQNVTTMTKNIKLAAGVLASLAGIEGVR